MWIYPCNHKVLNSLSLKKRKGYGKDMTVRKHENKVENEILVLISGKIKQH